MKKNVLIIEDQKEIAKLIGNTLNEAGYKPVYAYDGEKGLQLARSREISLIILDIILPGKSGLEILKELRTEKVYTPILVLSTRNTTENIVEGLTIGADDYVPKPFKTKELLARVEALFRRSQNNYEKVMRYDDLVVDINNKSVIKNDKKIRFKLTAFNILLYLLKNIGTTITREQLIENIWYGRPAPSIGTIDVHVNNIRNLLDPTDRHTYIRTVHGVGYTIEPEE